jgi:hypothetical protein
MVEKGQNQDCFRMECAAEDRRQNQKLPHAIPV